MNEQRHDQTLSDYRTTLEGLLILLDHFKEGAWCDWLAEDLRSANEDGGVDHHLSAYGGTGSFNDLTVARRNGHPVTELNEPWLNCLLSDLRSISYYLARHINEPASTNGVEVSLGTVGSWLSGMHCRACDYAETSLCEIERYVAFTFIRRGVVKALKESTLLDFVRSIIAGDEVPGSDFESKRVRKVALDCGIVFVKRDEPIRSCPSCHSTNTAAIYWSERGRFVKRFEPV